MRIEATKAYQITVTKIELNKLKEIFKYVKHRLMRHPESGAGKVTNIEAVTEIIDNIEGVAG